MSIILFNFSLFISTATYNLIRDKANIVNTTIPATKAPHFQSSEKPAENNPKLLTNQTQSDCLDDVQNNDSQNKSSSEHTLSSISSYKTLLKGLKSSRQSEHSILSESSNGQQSAKSRQLIQSRGNSEYTHTHTHTKHIHTRTHTHT